MQTYEALAANQLLRRMTASSQPRRDDLRSLLRRVIHRQVNHVVEDPALGFCLLLGYNITRTIAGKRKGIPSNYFIYTTYEAQSRRPATQQEVIQELSTLGIAEPAHYVTLIPVGETLVFYWNDELCIAFQRLEHTGRWARRHFPLTYFSQISLYDFNEGLRAGQRFCSEQFLGQFTDDGQELPLLATV